MTPAPNVPTATPGGPAAFASLRGLVRQITGAPAPSIAVELRPEIPTDASDPPRASTRTGQDGRYALERVANGRYLLSAGGGGAGSPQANVTVAGVDQTLDLEIESVARALVWLQLTGRVVDANDRGVPGARVWEADGECHGTTAADGRYRFIVIGDTSGPRRVLDATTSDRSGFVLATESSPQPPIRLNRPALSGVPSDVCPTELPAAPPAPSVRSKVIARVIPSLPSRVSTTLAPGINPSVVPKPSR